MIRLPETSDPAGQAIRQMAERLYEQKHRAGAEPGAAPADDRADPMREFEILRIERELLAKELQKSRRELSAARERFFNLYDLAPVGYIALNQQGLIKASNLTVASMLGIGRIALALRPLSGFIHPEEREKFCTLIEQLLEPGPAALPGLPQRICDFRMVRDDGTDFWSHWVAAAAADESDVPTMHIVLSDITESKRNEEKIVQLSLAVEQSPVLVVITDRSGTIEYVNPKFCEVTGYAREEVLGKNPRILKSGDKTSEEYHELWATITGGRVWKGEFHNKKKNGELYWELASISPIRNASGRIDHFLAVKEDITARKNSERELREKSAEMERFTAAVSHDLKSPLVTIKTFLSYLRDDLKNGSSDSVEKDLDFIGGAAERMGVLLEELLELAKVGHKNAPFEIVSLQTVVQEALIMVAGQIAQKHVRLDVCQDPILLFGDRPRLVAVFENLIDNAVKFLGDQSDPRIQIAVDTDGVELVFHVRDNGMGVDLRHQSKLFGLFEKLDPHAPGTGMGLAMVRRIIEMHGGKIWMTSEGHGLGTTFSFTLAHARLHQP